MTVYARLGNWLPYLLIALVFAYIAFAVRRAKREEITVIALTLLPHSLEWYELWERVQLRYEQDFAIDWNNWNL